MSDRAQMLADLKAMIVRECDKDMDPSEIGDDDRLIGGDLDLDSLDALQISMAVKENFGVRIEGGPDARKALASVASLADFIEAERSKAA
ncbi:acyl carrier protein [Caulobacter sp. SLTY]|uniref:phosphopantetheine-binding protein n=1 Tax=Caulobacter sp. SLTY TaxID=2683262 RepID=UPI001412EE44|nr:phosphopantetheine-binding protein [Caulobacter sp. SLTY]NBB14235.1 acyl carrier protein [Caulobacter sp. SLTY]